MSAVWLASCALHGAALPNANGAALPNANGAALPSANGAALPSANGAALPSANVAALPTVQQPRPFGYVLGDTLVQRILLKSAGHNFDPAALPPVERAGLWFARRSSRIELAEDGYRWLTIDYQLINAPQALMTVNLPSVTLKSKPGGDVLTVPEWPISIAPLTPRAAFAKGGLQELRPDHPAPSLPTRALRRQLAIWSGAFALTVLIWLAWWLVRSIRASANQPFARALRTLRRSADDDEGAWLALHRAFDTTAGCAVQLSNLPVLFNRAPHFQPQRDAIEQFYAQSSVRFFGTDDSRPTGTPSTRWPLRTLCTTLRRIEKQNER
ncbi:MAG: calcium incorporation protein MxaA [Steroidobacteraceae bacterium]